MSSVSNYNNGSINVCFLRDKMARHLFKIFSISFAWTDCINYSLLREITSAVLAYYFIINIIAIAVFALWLLLLAALAYIVRIIVGFNVSAVYVR